MMISQIGTPSSQSARPLNMFLLLSARGQKRRKTSAKAVPLSR